VALHNPTLSFSNFCLKSIHTLFLNYLWVTSCTGPAQVLSTSFPLQDSHHTQNILHYLISNYGYDNMQLDLQMKGQTSPVSKLNSMMMLLKLSGICRAELLMCSFPVDTKKLQNSWVSCKAMIPFTSCGIILILVFVFRPSQQWVLRL
jgi:hypothetical protein